MQDSDESLLKFFAAHRDEETFRALADRYLGLIFHTSLRRTGNRQIAEEVGQNILCALANKAPSLSRHPERLAAWLHRATLFESSKAMRSESSYQRRKALRHPDETTTNRTPETERWADAVPHLDAALDQLSETDRQVLLLHYFEKLTYPRIASRFGKTPEAVKKQSQRAMDKLARLLRARGVPLSITVLVTGLTGEFAKAAPLTLAQSAAAAAFAGHATHSATALTLMFASKSIILIPLIILLCAIPIGLQQLAISNALERNGSLRGQLASAGNTEAGSTVGPPGGSKRIHGLSTSTDILVLVDEYDEARRSEGVGISSDNQRIMRFKEKLAGLDTDTLVRVIRECATLRIQFSKKSQTFHVLIDELAARDPGLAVSVKTSAIETEPRLKPAMNKDEVLIQNAKRQIESLQKSQTQTDDQLFRSLTSPSCNFKLHLSTALELAGRIKDPVKRAAAIEHLNKP